MEIKEARSHQEVQVLNMAHAVNPVQEAMGIKEMQDQLGIQVRESFHNKGEVLKEAKEIPEEMVTETEGVKIKFIVKIVNEITTEMW